MDTRSLKNKEFSKRRKLYRRKYKLENIIIKL